MMQVSFLCVLVQELPRRACPVSGLGIVLARAFAHQFTLSDRACHAARSLASMSYPRFHFGVASVAKCPDTKYHLCAERCRQRKLVERVQG